MEVASKLISAAIPRGPDGNAVNPLDARFAELALSTMEPVGKQSKEFGALQAYARDTHGATHRHYQAEVLQAFRVERCVSYAGCGESAWDADRELGIVCRVWRTGNMRQRRGQMPGMGTLRTESGSCSGTVPAPQILRVSYSRVFVSLRQKVSGPPSRSCRSR